jgi:hypothetical protein
VFTNFGFVGFDFTGATSSIMTGVNNSVNNKMKVVGYAAAACSSPIGLQTDFSFDPATGATTIAHLQQVYFPGSQFKVPVKINDAGQIAGLYVDSGGKQHGFLLSKGQYSTIDFPGAVATEVLAINNWPVPAIAGDYADAAGRVHGFVGIAGQLLPVNAGFATNLSLTGISDLGEMTGIYNLGGQLGTAPNPRVPWVRWLANAVELSQQFTAPIVTSTLFRALNNKGEIAGTAQIQSPTPFVRVDAFLEGGGKPGLTGSLPTGLSALMTPGSRLDRSRI